MHPDCPNVQQLLLKQNIFSSNSPFPPQGNSNQHFHQWSRCSWGCRVVQVKICQHFWNTLLLAEKSAKICECATFRGKICMETMSGGESGFKCFWPNCRVANQDMSTQVNLFENIFFVTWDYLKNLLRSSAYFISYLWVDLMKNHFHILQKKK